MKLIPALSQEPTVFLSRKLWRFSDGMHGRIILYVAMFTVSNLIVLLPPVIFGAFINEVQSNGIGGSNLHSLMFLLLLLFLTEIAFWAFHGPARVIERSVAFWAEVNYRTYLLKGVLDLGLTWHADHDSGDTIDKVNKAGDSIASFGQNVFQIVQVVVKLLGTSIILYLFSPPIGVIVFVMVLVSFVIIFQFDRYLVPQYRRLNEYGNKAIASVFDALSNVTSVKILHIENPILDGVVSRMKVSHGLYASNSKLNESKWFTGAVFFQAIAVVPIALYLYYGNKNGQTVSAGNISTLYLYLSNLIYIYFGFTGFYQDLAIYKNRILNARPIEAAFASKNTVQRSAVEKWNTLEVRDLKFAYEGVERSPNLIGVNLVIRKGERIAVIGESGSGKTTFLKVLHGLYSNAEGTLILDTGLPQKTSFADLDLKTMLVPQEPELFSSTIRENMTLGVVYSERDVLHAMHIARFEHVAAELPHGLESVINEKGVNLSGGQKQRLALARALLFSKDKEMILLDESTSSVDSGNETEIYNNIWAAFAGKTVIASIHKMNLLRLFDRIYMFEKGKVIDVGTFNELLGRNASFRRSWERFVAINGE